VLTKLRDKMDSGQSDMIQLRAAELLGKSVGMFKDVQVQEVPRSTEEIQAELAKLLAKVPPDKTENAVH